MDMKLDEALAAYRGGLRADILQAKTDGKWGPIWTIPPCSPVAMERAGRQFARSRAQAVRHSRRAHLRRPSAPSETVNVVVITEFPGREQSVTIFDGVPLRLNVYLEDEALAALAAAFSPPGS
jgi:hypothetical protein